MAHFIKYSCKLILALLALILMTILVNRYLFYQNHKQSYQQGYETLLLGDSKFRSLNPNVVAPNSKNLFQDGDTYEVMYYKLKMISKFNDLDHLVLAFSYNNLAPIAEERISHTEGMLKRIFAISSLREIASYNTNWKGLMAVLAKNVFSINTRYLHQFLVGKLKRYNTFDTRLNYPKAPKLTGKTKSWYNTVQGRKIAIDKMIKHQFAENEYSVDNQRYSIYFLDKIIELAQNNSINVHLVTMPIDPIFRSKIPITVKNEFIDVKQRLKANANVKYHDFSSNFDQKLHLLKNQNHANKDGGVIISQLIAHGLN